MRSSALAAAWILAGLGGCGGVARVVESPAPPASALAVGTCNVRYDEPRDGADAWPRRRAMVVELLRGADVWGLQEALPHQIDALRADLPEFAFVARSRDVDPDRSEACPILFRRERWRLDPDDHGTFWLSETPAIPGSRSWDAALPRIVTFARLTDVATARSCYVFNTHFDHRGAEARLQSARLLARRIDARRHADPVVVLGDCNAGPDSPPLQALRAGVATGLVDAWRAANPGAGERGTFHGFGPEVRGERIDHVLVGAGFDVVACAIDDRRPGGRWPSDHLPVTATLRQRP